MFLEKLSGKKTEKKEKNKEKKNNRCLVFCNVVIIFPNQSILVVFSSWISWMHNSMACI